MTTRREFHAHAVDRIWLMAPGRLQMLVDSAAASTIALRQQLGTARSRTDFERVGNVAVVDVAGSLTKYGNFFDLLFGTGSAMLDIGVAIDKAAADPDVASIVLRVDSPGGSSSGTADLAAKVAAANKLKPTIAFIEDVGASAAYWIASQAGKLYSNATGMVGCIGTYDVLYDSSAAADKLGFKVLVVKAGEFKGVGVPGSEVTDDQVAEIQRLVDGINSHFVAGVAAGRKLSSKQAADLADGRLHIGAAAQQLGLSDGVRTWSDVLAEAQKAKKPAGATLITRGRPIGSVAALPAAKSRKEARCEAVAEFQLAVTRRVTATGEMRSQAAAAVARKNPELYAAYKEAIGAG